MKLKIILLQNIDDDEAQRQDAKLVKTSMKTKTRFELGLKSKKT